MVVAQKLLTPLKALLKQRQRAVVVALGFVQYGKMVERGECVGVVVAENAPPLLKALLKQRQRAAVVFMTF